MAATESSKAGSSKAGSSNAGSSNAGSSKAGSSNAGSSNAEARDAARNPSSSSGRAGDGETPPVVLISIDTLRSDFLPVYGYDGVETPALDRFAEDAVVFERAYSHYPLTFPSHVSLLTGRLPASAGVRGNSRYRLEDDVTPYLPATLQERGYATAGAVSSFVLRGETGMSRGFDVYHGVDLDLGTQLAALEDDESGELEAASIEQRAGSETLDLVWPWLTQQGDPQRGEGPFFLFFHIYEPHLPHTPPEPFRSRWGDTYEGEIAAADAVVGRLLDELRGLGVYDEALIFVLSDHGEEFGEHGEEGHGLLLYRQSLQVPLMVKFPSTTDGPLPWAGARHPHPVQLADVTLTVFDVLGLPAPPNQSSGARSLLRVLEGAGDDSSGDGAERPIFSETLYPRIHYGWKELTSLIWGDLHLISGIHAELFDLAADPAEESDILRDRRRDYRALDEVRQALAEPYERPDEEEDEETRRRLESLGYLSSSGASSGEPTRDPRDVMPEFGPKLKAAEDALKAKRNEEAARLYEELVKLDDGMPASWQSLGMARLGLGDHAGAYEALERSLRLDPKPITAQMAARCLLHLERYDEAEEHALLAMEGGEPGGREVMIHVQIARGRLDEAMRWADRDLGLDGLLPPTLLRLGKALVQDGREAAAGRVLEVLTEVDPTVASWNERARLAIETGDGPGAHQALQQSMALEPRNAGALEWLGLLALQGGRLDEAGALLQESLGKDATSANAWNLLAVVRFQKGNAASAVEAWQEAVRLDPGHLDALYNLGLTALRMGRRELALQTLRQYAEQAASEPGRAAEQAEVQQMIRGLGG